jgi:hypothetical protein
MKKMNLSVLILLYISFESLLRKEKQYQGPKQNGHLKSVFRKYQLKKELSKERARYHSPLQKRIQWDHDVGETECVLISME